MGAPKLKAPAPLEFCTKHPSSSPLVGVCAKCLRDRLLSLLCSHCGHLRLSCSCSDLSPRRSSAASSAAAAAVEVGSVGRISFLIHNDLPVSSSSPCFENNSGEPRKSSASRLLRALFRMKNTPPASSACSSGEQRASSASVEEGLFKGGGDTFWGAGKRVFSLREGELGGDGDGDGEFIDFRLDSAGVFCRNYGEENGVAGGGGSGKKGRRRRVWRRWSVKKKECDLGR